MPIRLRRTGRELKLLVPGAVSAAQPDPNLVKLLVRAHQFRESVIRSDGMPGGDLAKRQGLTSSYFTRVVRLAFLAPDIVTAILDGRHPPELAPKIC